MTVNRRTEDLGNDLARERDTNAPAVETKNARYASVGQFRAVDVAQGATDTAMTHQAVDSDAPTSQVAGRSGRIVGVAARLSADVTAETLVVAPSIDGVVQTQVATLSDLVQQVVQKFTVPIAFAEGALLGAGFTTGAGFLPTGSAELQADLLVEWDPQ